ncbi:hypothetical protein Gohar_005693 [Gossypium harknessii]|uniref:Uncharacterized protein n=1 Tax=Gossypium harknessii TaxID=34285 RepID=A0A7J9H8Z8_9ROSI|nr:hypothetical protein [Gossypium harknessii]
MDSCSSLRRGVLAQRRLNIQGNRFPFTAEASRRAAVAPLRSGAFNGSRAADFLPLGLHIEGSSSRCDAFEEDEFRNTTPCLMIAIVQEL